MGSLLLGETVFDQDPFACRLEKLDSPLAAFRCPNAARTAG